MEIDNRGKGDSVTNNQLVQLSRSAWVGKQKRIEMTECGGGGGSGGGGEVAYKRG